MERKKRSAGTARDRRGQAHPVHPVCMVPNCGRRSYARGLCQTHHKQFLATGEVKPIRPYRPRSTGTITFSGLRLSKNAAREVDRKAARERTSRGAAVAAILEAWVRHGAKPPSAAA